MGNSSAMIASAMLALSSRPLTFTLIRKEGEHSHTFDCTKGYTIKTYDKVAIVDDFISTGATTNKILAWSTQVHVDIQTVIVSHFVDGDNLPKFCYKCRVITVGERR